MDVPGYATNELEYQVGRLIDELRKDSLPGTVGALTLKLEVMGGPTAEVRIVYQDGTWRVDPLSRQVH